MSSQGHSKTNGSHALLRLDVGFRNSFNSTEITYANFYDPVISHVNAAPTLQVRTASAFYY
jgi:hypothetical protein